VGEVFAVRRTVPAEQLAQVDPFLMLDHFDFPIAKGQLGGLAPHPHRGIETVTVLFDGAIEHGDSLGNRALLESGGVQWMTAGSGIVHEENPADVLRQKGGRVHGLQLWVNLPARAKMVKPGYQDRDASKIKEVKDAGVRARVIAGKAHDVESSLHTHTPLTLVDYTLSKGAEAVLEYPESFTAFLHVVEGVIEINGTRVGAATLALLSNQGTAIQFHNPTNQPARVVLGGGLPIAEPLARYGPFAMNTQAELQQAMDDYRSGRMGRVDNPTYDRIKLR
jgi:quercetin 2,3-dioxygenase